MSDMKTAPRGAKKSAVALVVETTEGTPPTTATPTHEKAAKKPTGRTLTKAAPPATALATMSALDMMAGDNKYVPEIAPEERAANFLRLAQAMSPVTKKLEPTYLVGCTEGTFYTTLSRRVMETVQFLPCFFTKNYTWWKPRNAGGGLVKNFGTDRSASRIMEAVRNDTNGKSELQKVEGLPVVEVVEASVYFGLIVMPDGTVEETVLSLSSTQLKVARKFNATIHQQKHPRTGAPLPIFCRVYELSAIGESNDRGSWAGLSVAPGPMLPDLSDRWDVLYVAAKSLADDCLRGAKHDVVDVGEATITDLAEEEETELDDYIVDEGDEALV